MELKSPNASADDVSEMLSKPKSFEERRPATRVAVDLEASYAKDGKQFRQTRLREISVSGIRMLTSEPLIVDSLIDIDVTFDRDQRVRIKVQVVRLVTSNESVFDYGVKVVSDNAMRNALRAAVLQVSLRGAAKVDPNAVYIAARHFRSLPRS